MHEVRLIKASAQAGHGLPKEIAAAPELLSTLRLFWNCYFDLRRGKTRDQALQWWEIQYWCETYEIDRELARAVHMYTLEIDNIWIELQPKQREAPPDGLPSGNKRR